MKKYTDKKYLKKCLKEGKTIKQIAKENGVYPSTVMRYTSEYGIKFPRGKCQEQDYADRIGESVGIMKIVSFAGYKISRSGKSKTPYFNCLCQCGRISKVHRGQLRFQKSCGCLRYSVVGIDRAKIDINEKFEQADSTFNRLYATYRHSAVKNGRSFDLSKKEFYYLTKQNCHYCGIPAKQLLIVRKTNFWSFYYYNGVDRLDNNKGYELDNVVSCCLTCNKAKSYMTYEDFNCWIDRLINVRNERRNMD